LPLPQEQLQSVSFALVQPGGQQPSPDAQVVCMPLSVQRAVHEAAAPSSLRSVQPMGGQLVGQEPTGSQLSPLSTTLFPHVALQSLSLAALHAAGQQPSAFTHAVWATSFTHWAWQVPGLASRRNMQPMGGHEPGQLPSGSQVSPHAASIMLLPHVHAQSLSFATVQPDGQH
jgi:hypothetical protein